MDNTVFNFSWTEQDFKKHNENMERLSNAVVNIINSYVSMEYVVVKFSTCCDCTIVCERDIEFNLLKDDISLIISELNHTDVQLTDSRVSLSRINVTISTDIAEYKEKNKTVHETHSIIIKS